MTCIINNGVEYPLDVYTVDLPYAATIGDPILNANAKSLPWTAYAYGAMHNYRFNLTFSQDKSNSVVTLTIVVKRAPTTIVFSVFIVLLMWFLSMSAFIIAFQARFRMRDVPAPLLAVFVSLLFALPAMRNTQPAVPPIGTLLDSVSLFWNMFLVAVSCIMVMFVYVEQGPEPKPPTRSEKGELGSWASVTTF